MPQMMTTQVWKLATVQSLDEECKVCQWLCRQRLWQFERQLMIWTNLNDKIDDIAMWHSNKLSPQPKLTFIRFPMMPRSLDHSAACIHWPLLPVDHSPNWQNGSIGFHQYAATLITGLQIHDHQMTTSPLLPFPPPRRRSSIEHSLLPPPSMALPPLHYGLISQPLQLYHGPSKAFSITLPLLTAVTKDITVSLLLTYVALPLPPKCGSSPIVISPTLLLPDAQNNDTTSILKIYLKSRAARVTCNRTRQHVILTYITSTIDI